MAKPGGLTLLGGLTMAVSALFGVGLLLAMARAAWQPDSSHHNTLAFFGFAIPMVLLAAGTFALWEENKKLQVVFGWICVLFGLIWAIGLFILIADWVKILGIRQEAVGLWEGIALFVGFIVPMLVCGGSGIGIIVDSASPK